MSSRRLQARGGSQASLRSTPTLPLPKVRSKKHFSPAYGTRLVLGPTTCSKRYLRFGGSSDDGRNRSKFPNPYLELEVKRVLNSLVSVNSCSKTQKQTTETVLSEEDEDEEEEERGIPQAIRLPDSSVAPKTPESEAKQLHCAKMEELVRKYKPRKLRRSLHKNGYFNFDYSGSTRSSRDKSSSKESSKRGMERLYKILALNSRVI